MHGKSPIYAPENRICRALLFSPSYEHTHNCSSMLMKQKKCVLCNVMIQAKFVSQISLREGGKTFMNGNPDPIEDERVVLGTRTTPAPSRFRTSYQRRANINKSRTRSTRKITRAMPRRRMLLRGGAAALAFAPSRCQAP